MRWLLLLSALAMPVIAFLSQRGLFGPDNGTLSDRYPTLLVAAGYAFSIWSVIFLLDVMFAARQALRRGADEPRSAQVTATLGFALSAGWMIVFSRQWFWLALAVIFGALAALLLAMLRAQRPLARWALGLHAGWLSLAAFLNLAQVIVAYRLLPAQEMLPWSLALWLLAGTLLLLVNRRQRGHPAYVLAALWGLFGVVVAQWPGALPGARVSAGVAGVLAVLLLLQTWRLRRADRDGPPQTPMPT